jgi:pyruvate dehydrogenase E2 component (dihydrolipoamide acetyltransferase)
MAVEVLLPRFGRTMEQATILNIHVQPGCRVTAGQVLADLETDKAAMEMESPCDGVIHSVLVEAGWTLPVETPMFLIAENGEQVDPAHVEELAQKVAQARRQIDDLQPGRIHVVEPAVRSETHPAEEILSRFRPAVGPLQAVKALETAAPLPLSEYKLGMSVPLNRWQLIVAEKMLESKRSIPCFYLNLRADVTDLVRFRGELNESADPKITFNDLIIRALTLSLQRYPILTGRLKADAIELASRIEIGIAVATDHGLVAPVLKGVQSMDIQAIARATDDLIGRARRNALTPEDLEGGCISISNLGSYGIDSFIPIVIPGQTAIIGIGRIVESCVPDGDGIKIRKLMALSIAVDHRIVNGADAAQFLDYAKKLLERPQDLVA